MDTAGKENDVRAMNTQENNSSLDNSNVIHFKQYAAIIKSKLLANELKLSAKRGRSKVWDTFSRIVEQNGEVNTEVVVCNTCKNVYKFEKSTSNLVKHKCYIMANSRSHPVVDVDMETKKKCTKLATEWTVKNGRSFNIISDSGLKNLAQFFISVGAKFGENINVESLLPHPTSISRNIGALYEFHFNEIKAEIAEFKKYGYAITSDIWTDDFYKVSYLSLTIHYVKLGTLKNRLLAVKSMEGVSCTGNRIKHKIETILRDFGCDLLMDEPIVVTDRGANMKAAFSGLSTLYCANHLVHNVIGKVVNEVLELGNMVNRCSKLVKYFKKSGHNFLLKSTLKSYCPTRWNTIYHLFKSIEMNWMDISNILIEKNEIVRIQEINLSDVSALVNLLAPFDACSKKLEGSHYPTIHLTIPYINNLKKSSTLSDNDMEMIKKCKLSLKKNLEKIVQVNLKKYHNVALFLFPPTNKLSQFTELEKEDTMKDLEAIMLNSHLKSKTEDTESIVPPNSVIDPIFQDYLQPIQSNNNGTLSIINEIQRYKNVSIPYIEDFNVLKWWSNNKEQFPLLYKVSCKVLAVPASSAAYERAFSVAKNLISDKRCKIATTEDMVNKILFLHSNIEVLNYESFLQ